ncbi:hypothetical protein MMC08_005699 [Hypocenomyce scalaris]|nr:hypothetical protein [Hypocenomyce scalaris]
MYWLWGGVALPTEHNEPGQDDEHVVDNIEGKAPFVPIAHGQPVVGDANAAEGPARDPEEVTAAVEAGLDPKNPDAIEDGEDLEGILELIGMQGPLAELVQSGTFSAVLVPMTVFIGIWIPYLSGKIVLVFLANPVPPLIKLLL